MPQINMSQDISFCDCCNHSCYYPICISDYFRVSTNNCQRRNLPFLFFFFFSLIALMSPSGGEEFFFAVVITVSPRVAQQPSKLTWKKKARGEERKGEAAFTAGLRAQGSGLRAAAAGLYLCESNTKGRETYFDHLEGRPYSNSRTR